MYDSVKPSCLRVSTLDINSQGQAPLGPSLSPVHVALTVPAGLGGQLPGVGLLQAWLGSGTPSTHPPLSDLESEPPLPAPSLPAPPKEGRPALTRGSPGNHIQSHLGVSFQEPMVQGADGAFSSFWDRSRTWDSAHGRSTARFI